MKVLVCGSRHFKDYNLLKETLDEFHNDRPITEIIHGGAKGADSLAGFWAFSHSPDEIRVRVFPAKWDEFGKRAGPIRNTQMLTEGKPEAVVAFIAKDSRGTRHMVEISKKAGIEVKEIQI